MRRQTTLVLLVVALAVAIAVGCFAWFVYFPAGTGATAQLVDVGQGATLKRISADLAAARIVSSSHLFEAYGRLVKAGTRIKAGTYQFNDGMAPTDILKKLVDGDVCVRRFAVPEGYSIHQVAELLESRGIYNGKKFLRLCSNPELLRELGIRGPSVEGYLYPATYDLPPNMDEEGAIHLMVAEFNRIFTERYTPPAAQPALTPRQVVTLASMVEKEAVRPEERPLIASVFLNRLRKGMRLQSDPTAVYGVRAFGGTVTKQDIMRPSPYNTYLIDGLPPGPIGNPGWGAIEAVLKPTRSDYLYFVARKDGSHQFSTTLDAHNAAVRTYLRSGPPTPTLSRSVPEVHSAPPHPAGGR